MKCPYCLESISEGAIVCKFCERDLNFFTPLFKQISTLNKKVDVLNSLLKTRLQSPNETLGLPDVAPLAAVLLSVLLASFLGWLDWQGFASGLIVDSLAHGVAIASPFFGGLVLGRFRRVRVSVNLLLGFVAGLFGAAQMFLLYALGHMDTALMGGSALTNPQVTFGFAVPTHWVWALLYYSVFGAFLFLFGGRVAERFWPKPDDALEAIGREGQSPTERLLVYLSQVTALITVLKPLLTPLAKFILSKMGWRF